MDKEQEEMQFVGCFGIFVESYRAIFAWRKIFTKITLSLILPLSFIYLVHMEVSNLFFRTIIYDEIELHRTRSGTARYEKLSDLISDEWAYFFLFKAAYFTLYFIFSLISSAAVVYTVACIHRSGTQLQRRHQRRSQGVEAADGYFLKHFHRHVSVQRLGRLVHFSRFDRRGKRFGFGLFVIFAAVYVVGFLYLTVIWHLASVVSVLEEAYGFNAMVKGKNLIKGNTLVAVVIFPVLGMAGGGVQFAFQRLVLQGNNSGMGARVVYAIICLFLHSMLSLFGLVIQTVIYFVCKSYHHENIDKSALSDHWMLTWESMLRCWKMCSVRAV
ncbi:putative Kinase family protein with leucine-rich repeat domain [Hibiscus syriacus]|uniref:Kinase family protein with leucine-rich repeat domain n=1 Tax=Hibiscus syriacus TaxID=106335 RepID=A0A6A3ASG9_HIBSY|nr:putative Kinase family protein with leucine-rich repeat domain [Hibiscus syriacus]